MKYQDRIVVFIDILGFKDILDKTIDKNNNDNEVAINKLVNAYNTIKSILDIEENSNEIYIEETNKVITTFSDCIVISFPIKNNSEIYHTIYDIKLLIINLINIDILCRGAFSYGKLIHNKSFIFGPALVEAYILETKAANYPRIILDNSIIELASQSASHHEPIVEIEYIQSLIEKDLDGLYYIDYFKKAYDEIEDFPKYLEKIGTFIRNGLNKFSKIPNKADVYIKYNWIRKI